MRLIQQVACVRIAGIRRRRGVVAKPRHTNATNDERAVGKLFVNKTNTKRERERRATVRQTHWPPYSMWENLFSFACQNRSAGAVVVQRDGRMNSLPHCFDVKIMKIPQCTAYLHFTLLAGVHVRRPVGGQQDEHQHSRQLNDGGTTDAAAAVAATAAPFCHSHVRMRCSEDTATTTHRRRCSIDGNKQHNDDTSTSASKHCSAR